MAYSGSTAAILSNYAYVLKTFYLPAIREQINNATPLLKRLKRNQESVSGKNATIAVHYGRNLGTIALGDGDLLPDAGYQKVIETTVPTKYNYGRITVSGPTIAATRDNRGAYAKAIDYEMKGMVRDLTKDINRQLWGSGHGILARWRSTTSGTVYTLQKAYIPDTGGAGFGSTFGAKYLMPEGATGMEAVVVVYTGSSTNTIAVDTTDISPSALTKGATYDTITVSDPSVTEAAGTVYIKGNSLRAVLYGTGATEAVTRKEMMGLWGIVNDKNPSACFTTDAYTSGEYDLATPTTLQGLSASTYSWWQANVFSHPNGRFAGQRALTTVDMQEAVDAIEEQLSDDTGNALSPTIILTTRAIRRQYVDLLLADRRFVEWKTLDGGFKAVEFNGIPLVVDNDAIDGDMYFLYEPALQIYQMSDLDWMDKDGNILNRIANYDAYEATLFWYAELGCSRRNVHSVLTDIAY